MRHTSTARNDRIEFLQDENVLSNRITQLGLSASRLAMTLSNLRDEDQVVWFDCEIRDRDFAEFGTQTTGAPA
jgi:hypothetical protein